MDGWGKRVWFYVLLASFSACVLGLGLICRYGHLRRDEWSKVRRGKGEKGHGRWMEMQSDGPTSMITFIQKF